MTKLKSSEEITIHTSELKNIQSLLLKTNYELREIWNSFENNEMQVLVKTEFVIDEHKVHISEFGPISREKIKDIYIYFLNK